MSAARTVHGVFMDLEIVTLDLKRLASAVEIIGMHAKVDGIEPHDGGAIEVLGEVMAERLQGLVGLLEEGMRLNGRADHV